MRGSRLTALFTVALAVSAASARSEGFLVVVHPSVEGSRISRSVLASIYEKEVVRWGDHTRILPVDQSSHQPIRQAFASEVLGRSLGEVQLFWRRRMASTRTLPPPVKESDEEVLAFVAEKEGAIGYVSNGIVIPPEVKVLALVD